MKTSSTVLLSLILGSGLALAQSKPAQSQTDQKQSQTDQKTEQAPRVQIQVTPSDDVVQPLPMSTDPKGAAAQAPSNAQAQPKKTPDKAMAYYHYSLAHMYEELVAVYQRTEFANRAIEEYRLAIENDPKSEYLNAGLAELYAKTGRIRDAVLEAQDIIQRDPDNVDARRLLGRIYLRSLGDMQSGTQSQDILKKAIEQYEQIVRLQPNSVEDRLLLGRLYRINNDTKKAEEQFREAVKQEPNSEDALTTLAYLYNEGGDSKRALELLNAVPEPERTGKMYSALGYTYEQEHDYKNAIAAYKKAIDQDKDNLDYLRSLAQNLMNDGQNDAALQQYRAIVEADPQDPQSYMRMAEIYRRNGQFDKALAALTSAQANIQDSLEVPYNKAVILQAQGKFDEATQILQNLVQKTDKPDGNYSTSEKNNRAIFLERLGGIYRDQNKTDLAAQTFKQMLLLGDDNVSRGYQELIETYRNAKQWPQATAVAQEAVQKLPNDRMLKLTLAQQLADNGQGDAALAEARKLLKGTPEDRETYLSLANIEARMKRWKEAEDDVNKALQLSSKDEERNYGLFIQASIMERQKKYDQAESIFRRLLDRDPNNAMVLNYLGYMLADRGTKLEESLTLLKKAIQLDPQNGAYLDSIGWAYFRSGQYDLAEENLRRAIDRTGNDPTVHDHLGDVYARTGRLKLAAAQWERAMDEFNKSVAADVDRDEVQKVSKKLESAKTKLAHQQGAK
jgi:tetratricopeptide (TPR) repeat protein